MEENNYWRKCSSCKKEIGLGKAYQICEVTSCKKHAFCSVSCWNLHNEIMNHKSAGAIEMRAPFVKEPEIGESVSVGRRIIVNPNNVQQKVGTTTTMDHEVLIVASKLKQYVKEKHDLNTSANVMDILSNIVRRVTDEAASKAMSSGRKTLMDRDFE